MIDKGEIIKKTLLKLGENSVYNDNKDDIYTSCEIVVNSVIDNIAYSSAFLFNATTVELTNVGKVDDEYKFNLPIDCLNLLRCSENYRLENEYIYSGENSIKIQYCRRIDLSEYPENLFNLLVAMSAREMSLAYNTYNNLYQLMDSEVTRLRNDVISQQGFQYWGD